MLVVVSILVFTYFETKGRCFIAGLASIWPSFAWIVLVIQFSKYGKLGLQSII
jgi:hypothetical protein